MPDILTRQVLVFRTNLNTKAEVQKIKQALNKKAIIQWSVDMEDCDKVLRVITENLTPADIIGVLRGKGLECVEME